MWKMSRRGFAALAAALAFSFAGASAHAQQLPVIRASSLTLPVFNPLVWNIMKARGFDAKHGFELEAKPIRRSRRSMPPSRPARPTC